MSTAVIVFAISAAGYLCGALWHVFAAAAGSAAIIIFVAFHGIASADHVLNIVLAALLYLAVYQSGFITGACFSRGGASEIAESKLARPALFRRRA